MTITKQEVEHIAKLARLNLSKAEIDKYGKEMTAILSWIDQLSELDTSDVETNSKDVKLVLHKDEVSDGDIAKSILENAPNSKYNYFVVPKVIDAE